MNDPVVFGDGQLESPPIVLPRALFLKIQRLASQANMEAVELVQLALAEVFNDPDMSLERLARIIRQADL